MTAAGRSPAFGVGIPAFNAADTLPQTLDALLAQTYSAWDCVVVDDGSTDATTAVAATYAARDPRIRVVTLERNSGCAAARNIALRATSGEVVCRLDADDYYEPTYLEVMAQMIESHPAVDIFSCNGLKLLPDGSTQPVLIGSQFEHSRSYGFSDLVRGNPIFGMAVVQRALFDRLGGFPENLHTEDYGFWLRALASGAKHLYVPQVLSVYRIGPGQMTADPRVQIVEARRALSDVCGELGAGDPNVRTCSRGLELWDARLAQLDYADRLRDGEQGAVGSYLAARRAYRQQESAVTYWMRFLVLVLGGRSLLRRRSFGSGDNGRGAS